MTNKEKVGVNSNSNNKLTRKRDQSSYSMPRIYPTIHMMTILNRNIDNRYFKQTKDQKHP